MGRGTTAHGKPLEGDERDAFIARLIIGRSVAIQNVIALVRQVALHPSTPVLLQGESGTGKEVIAHAIHELSGRAAHQFVPINCAAIPETLLETELFGVEAGAFTDAVAREGHILRANGGTFFLDEIGSMPMLLQAKLLRFLETLSFRRVGGTKEIHVDLRIISATNLDLQAAVLHKTFRDDLFYRLKVITIYLPPLRERTEDIELLADYFMSLYSIEGQEPLRLDADALQCLLRYPWPGNVRELRSAILYGQIMCDHGLIKPKDLPEVVRTVGTAASQRLREIQQQLHLPPEGLNLPDFLGTIEASFMQEALQRCNGNQVRAAALLGISRDQLRYRLSARKVAVTVPFTTSGS